MALIDEVRKKLQTFTKFEQNPEALAQQGEPPYQFIEIRDLKEILSKPNCKSCISYEILKEERLKNFCSYHCIKMSELFAWKPDKDSCNHWEAKQ